MDIFEALDKLPMKKKEYFLWKHNLNLHARDKTEEELCKKLQVQTLNTYAQWEKTPEYANLMNILIESQSGKDLDDVYNIVREKALEGDEKYIKLLLELQKQARTYNKTMNTFAKQTEKDKEQSKYDGLEL